MLALMQQRKPSSNMWTELWAPLTQQYYRTGATLMMLHHPRPPLTSATSPTPRWRTLTRTWPTSFPRASTTLAAQLPTACAPAMASRSVASATPSLCSLRQPSSQRTESLRCWLHETMVSSTASMLYSSQRGVQMWTCSTVCLATRSLNTVRSTLPSVSLTLSHWRKFSPPSWGVWRKIAPPSRPCRSSSSTALERGTTRRRKPATSSSSWPCSGLHGTLSCSAWMGLVQCRSAWRKTSQQQHRQPWITTSLDQQLSSFRTWHCCISCNTSPCPESLAQNHHSGGKKSLSLWGHTAPPTPTVLSTSSTVNRNSCFTCHFGCWMSSSVTTTLSKLRMPLFSIWQHSPFPWGWHSSTGAAFSTAIREWQHWGVL